MIEELTQKQVATFGEYIKKWIDIGTNTDPANVKMARRFINLSYKKAGLTKPVAIIGPVNNPLDGCIAEWVLRTKCIDRSFSNEKKLNAFVLSEIKAFDLTQLHLLNGFLTNQLYGYQEHWLSYCDFFMEQCGIPDTRIPAGLLGLARYCGWWTPYKEVAVFQHRPEKISFDENRRLSCADGPAIKFRGHAMCDVYAYKGVKVAADIINRKFTANDIMKESNAEIRRVMIELYGNEKFLADSQAKLIDNSEWGKLFKVDVPDDEPLLLVELINSSPEPDGSFKKYIFRVNPNAYGGVTTARQAVASMWRHKKDTSKLFFTEANDYDPYIAT